MNYLQKKKLAFMSIVNSVKGFVRTVTGVPPLTLPDCVDEDSVIDYSITGEGVGDRINLFSVNTPHQMGFISTDGIYIVPDTNYPNVYCFLIEVEPNTTYSYRRVINNNFTYTLLNKNKGFLGIYGGKTTDRNVTFTTSTDTAYVYICGSLTSFNNGAMYLNKGTHYIEEPYDKYIIPIVCNGKNLFDKNNFTTATGYYNDDGNHTASANGYTWYIENYYPVYPNTKYTISGVNGYPEAPTAVYFYDKDKQWISRTKYVYGTAMAEGYTFTTPSNCKFVRFQIHDCDVVNDYNFLKDAFQIELGGTVTRYESYQEPVTTNIYLDEPLTEGETLTNPVKLPTFKGTTIYTVGTSIQPSDMSATYYATSKE